VDDRKNLWEQIVGSRKLVVIAGPCVIEGEELCFRIAEYLSDLCKKLGVIYLFKASFDKANRTSLKSFRGPGLETGLNILKKVRDKFNIPILTDIHEPAQAEPVSQVVDVIQIPAFLCRQTDLIIAAARTGKIVNIKKGQFLSPLEIGQAIQKAESVGNKKILLTERGTTFGYNNLVVDMRVFPIMKRFGYPLIFDATHSVQLPGGGGDRSSGQREFAPVLAKAAIAAGADGVFFETHPEPDKALSDGPNMIPLNQMPDILQFLAKLYALINSDENR
jgi:2-dehydro-3-deoxyphosphooctonate aldolase (KDO 8-P synthase)